MIVGINDYYSKPGIKSEQSLQGCVNDARAIKKLLLNRFGFKEANVQTLYNAEATRSRVLNLMRQTLKSCKLGDAFVFYYSGHGAWMRNDYEVDSVKKKMSQAMVMSDLYAPGLDCLLTDEDAKKVLNEFVDKKVVVTDICDCCYSGNGRMAIFPGIEFWTPLLPLPAEKSLDLHDIPYVPVSVVQKPLGCAIDSLGYYVNETDTDGDGVPDCEDWEPNTPLGMPVDSLGATVPISADQYIDFARKDPRFTDTTLYEGKTALSADDRSFDLKAALRVNYRPTERRPSERTQSRYLYLAASTDREKASEITDETGTQHGAFTKALLTVYKENPAGLLVSALLTKITELIKQQKYSHTPTYHFDPGRLAGNLLGIGDSGFSNTVTATCTGVKGTVVTLDKGLDDGLGKGNVFTGAERDQVLRVTAVDSTSAVAILKSGSVKKGQTFRLTNKRIASAPLVKLYIPEMQMIPAQYDAFFQKKVRPFLSLNFGFGYADFHSSPAERATRVVVFDDAVKHHDAPAPSAHTAPYTVVFLPVPSFVTTALKEKVKKHQNIELVNSIEKADFVLYLNYAKARPEKPGSFGFFYHPCLDHPGENVPPVFTKDVVETQRLQLSGSKQRDLLQKLYALTRRAIRYKSLVWINDDPKP
ncbi:caspase family protein [Flavisolibacter ginsenosidimutans]|uniref:caspase family protein n=1 Tax=Flavisolibacter ginsenosidimutans TaxID=661481 RepID=UPI00155A22D4|nr:caspase family protein [Flavisolibacter ginsenosidimutans]